MISDLPELDDLDQGVLQPRQGQEDMENMNRMGPRGMHQIERGGMSEEKLSKYLRAPFRGQYNSQDEFNQYNDANQSVPHQPVIRPPFPPVQKPRSRQVSRAMVDQEKHRMPIVLEKETNVEVSAPIVINCIDIAKHVENCPICSRFYNNDKSIHMIIIVVLSIICLLLLKKVLKV